MADTPSRPFLMTFTSLQDYYGGHSDDVHYEYHYNVHDDYGNNHGKQESRHGRRTDGSFYVYLPDGSLQKVYYYVDGDSGFVANVSYEERTRYDSHESYEHNDRYRSKEDSNEYGDRSWWLRLQTYRCAGAGVGAGHGRTDMKYLRVLPPDVYALY